MKVRLTCGKRGDAALDPADGACGVIGNRFPMELHIECHHTRRCPCCSWQIAPVYWRARLLRRRLGG
jgi:hypothetical protein